MNKEYIKENKMFLIILAAVFLAGTILCGVFSTNVSSALAKIAVLGFCALVAIEVNYYGFKKIWQAIREHKWIAFIGLLCLGYVFYKCFRSYRSYPITTVFGSYIMVFQVVLLPAVILGFMGIYVWKLKIWKLYLLIAAFVGVAMMLAIPLGGVPDEIVHLNTAYRVSNVFLGIPDTSGQVMMRMDDIVRENLGYGINQYRNLVDFETYITQLIEPLKDGTIMANSCQYVSPEYAYIVPAFGIAIGRILGLGTGLTLILGRLANFALFLALTTYAMKIIPVGKLPLMVLMLTPMTVQQGMSYSYDVIVNGISVVLIAYTLKILMNKEGSLLSKKELIFMAIILLLLLPIKGKAYCFVSIMPWVAYLWRKHPLSVKTQKTLKKVFIGIFLILVAGYVIWGFTGAKSYTYTPSMLSYTGNLEEGYSISYFLANPFDIFGVVLKTVQVATYFFIKTFLGASLGWFDINLPDYITIAYVTLFAFASFKRMNSTVVISPRIKKGLFFVALITIVFIFGGMLISWSPIKDGYIQGVQGRYFIPIALPLLLLLHSDLVKVSEKLDQPLLLATVLVIVNLTETVLMRL